MLALIGLYKRLLSPALPPACRFTPTCSEYARDCFSNLPFFRAFALSFWRLLRCNPLGKWGYDPAPRHHHY